MLAGFLENINTLIRIKLNDFMLSTEIILRFPADSVFLKEYQLS